MIGTLDDRSAGRGALRHVLRKVGEPGSLVDRVSDDGVLEAARGTDVPRNDPPAGHSDAGVEIGMSGEKLAELSAEVEGGAQRAVGVIVEMIRHPEDAQ